MAAVKNSLYILSRMMYVHYGRPMILLLDEYDVPPAKADSFGYYYESPIAEGRSKIRDAKCAHQTFICWWCVPRWAHEGLQGNAG